MEPEVGGICNILELEAAGSTEFATFLSSNCSCNMVVCNWGSFKVGFRVSLGVLFVAAFLRVGFRIRFYLASWVSLGSF